MIVKQIKLTIYFFIIFCIAGCSTYSSHFECPDARGLNCVMLSDVDAKVSSGEIEEVYKGSSCKGKNCKKDEFEKPDLVSDSNVNAEFKE